MYTSHVSERAWIAIQVHSGYEKRIAIGLEERGYEQFVPLRVHKDHKSPRLHATEQALFPGYVFCRFIHNPVHRIVEVPGVIRLVGVGKTPASIPETEIESIRRVVTSGRTTESCKAFSVGQPILIARGPLAGVHGILVATGRRTHLIVSISLLGRAIAVEVDANDVAEANKATMLAYPTQGGHHWANHQNG